MHITVKDKVVKHNLELLKDLLRRAKNERPNAWVEVTTGEMRMQAPSGPEAKQETWKVIRISLENDSKENLSLEIHEANKEGDNVFDVKGWTIKARRVVLETIHAINDRIAHLTRAKSHEFLDHFLSADIDLMTKHRQGGDDLVYAAWYDLDREGTERLLDGCPKGTYLFRKDPFAKVLEEEIHLRFGKETDCITLTYIDQEGLIRDKTLVYKDKGIIIYNDDPNLLGPTYGSISDFIQVMQPTLVFPLKNS